MIVHLNLPALRETHWYEYLIRSRAWRSDDRDYRPDRCPLRTNHRRSLPGFPGNFSRQRDA